MIQKNEDGYIVVETIGAFVPFLLLVISILSLLNIVAIQARVHYAMTQAANTLSMYSYTLEVLGVANSLTTLDNHAHRAEGEVEAIRSDINAVLTGINSISGIPEVIDSGVDAINRVTEVADDPMAALQLLMNYSVNELRNAIFEHIARPLIGRYLANGDMTGDEYLRAAGVVSSSRSSREGLGAIQLYHFGNPELGDSVLIDRNGNVKLVARYEIRYTFAGLPLPFGPTLEVTQTVITKAWLNGSGRGYQ